MVESAEPRVVFTTPRYLAETSAALASFVAGSGSPCTIFLLHGDAPGVHDTSALPAASPFPVVDAGDDDPAVILYTSGTTSDPKGVQHSHETLLYEIESLREMHAIAPEDRYLGGAPVAHIAGLVYGVLMPFVLGTRTVFLDRWEPERALQLIERERVTFQTGTPKTSSSAAPWPTRRTRS